MIDTSQADTSMSLVPVHLPLEAARIDANGLMPTGRIGRTGARNQSVSVDPRGLYACSVIAGPRIDASEINTRLGAITLGLASSPLASILGHFNVTGPRSVSNGLDACPGPITLGTYASAHTAILGGTTGLPSGLVRLDAHTRGHVPAHVTRTRTHASAHALVTRTHTRGGTI